MKDIIRMQQLAGIITENQARKMMAALNEAIGDFNPTGFMAAIKETLKKMGYQVEDMKGSSIDPFKGKIEDAANEGKKLAAVGTLKLEDGEEVVAAIGINQNDDTATQLKNIKELEDKIYNVYAKDHTARFNKSNNGRVYVIGIKNKKETTNELFGFGGTKATEKDSIRLDVRGGSIIFKPVVRGGTHVKIEKNDSDFDHIRVGDEIRITKSFQITAGKPFYIGDTEVTVNKLFLNGTETKSVTLPK